MTSWVGDSEDKCAKAWRTLKSLEADEKTKEVEAKVHHDLDVARARRKALAHVLGYDDSATENEPVKLDSREAKSRMLTYIEECKARAAAKQTSPAKPNEVASAASAAGDRAKLGQAPPCKTFADLRTFAEITELGEELLLCQSRDEIKTFLERLKPLKKSITELIAVGNGIGKDLKGAVTAARKRLQQDADAATKRRKVASEAATVETSKLFEFLPTYSGDHKEKVAEFPVFKLGTDPKPDLALPFLSTIPPDMAEWPVTLGHLRKVCGEFRVEFEASPLRSSVGRGQKPLEKMSADPNLPGRVSTKVFDAVVQPEKQKRDSLDKDMEALLAPQCFGLAKNMVTCVPEKGHLPTASLTLVGSASVAAFPIEDVLAFFVEEKKLGAKSELPVLNATRFLKVLPSDAFARFLGKLEGKKVFHGTAGPNDVLYIPPGWVSVQSTGSADALGVKMRFLIPDLREGMAALGKVLCDHDGGLGSAALDTALKFLQPAASP